MNHKEEGDFFDAMGHATGDARDDLAASVAEGFGGVQFRWQWIDTLDQGHVTQGWSGCLALDFKFQTLCPGFLIVAIEDGSFQNVLSRLGSEVALHRDPSPLCRVFGVERTMPGNVLAEMLDHFAGFVLDLGHDGDVERVDRKS